jgi:hypothetical protein
MLKLVRNLLFHRKVILFRPEHGEPSKISCTYLEELEKLQSCDSLYLANKLTGRHVRFQNVVMKVNIAAQTLSASVASAIDFLRDDLHLPQFKGSESTCTFIRNIDKLFDALNSRNPRAKGFKAPLGLFNQHHWEPFLKDTIVYLRCICEPTGQPIYMWKRRHGILGFILTTTAVLDMCKEMLGNDLKYLLTYKLSQDHLEMFLSKVN